MLGFMTCLQAQICTHPQALLGFLPTLRESANFPSAGGPVLVLSVTPQGGVEDRGWGLAAMRNPHPPP